ncbi:MAG: DNA-binding protein HU [Desulfonatronovibrio sp. MSAO_Bac4]|nr:MAG: DNA-binding protein HU [Desulfonatronovibrio sp. MSAO_Bac4]
MSRKAMIESIVEDHGCTKFEAEQMLDIVLKNLFETTAKRGRLTLRDFGTFKIINRAAKTGTNPQTKERIEIPGKKTVRFHLSQKLGKTLNS